MLARRTIRIEILIIEPNSGFIIQFHHSYPTAYQITMIL